MQGHLVVVVLRRLPCSHRVGGGAGSGIADPRGSWDTHREMGLLQEALTSYFPRFRMEANVCHYQMSAGNKRGVMTTILIVCYYSLDSGAYTALGGVLMLKERQWCSQGHSGRAQVPALPCLWAQEPIDYGRKMAVISACLPELVALLDMNKGMRSRCGINLKGVVIPRE